MEQSQYNLLERHRVEEEYLRLYHDHGLGLTTWSPLASGLLTGKYRDGIPEDSRGALPGYEWLRERLTSDDLNARVGEFAAAAARLAIAWCCANPHVSTVITGASRLEQLEENLGALEVVARLTPATCEELAAIFS